MEKLKPMRVIRDFRQSPFRARIGNYEFVFSSEYNLSRFKQYLPQEKKHFSDRVKKLYGMRTVYNAVTAFTVYRNVERRGYLVRQLYGDRTQEFYSPDCIEFVADVHFLPVDAP